MADNVSRAGMGYATPEIFAWCNQVHVPHDAGLARAFTVPDGVPAIMVGPSDGKLLAVISRLVAPRRAVEVGTLLGYSTIHLARGLASGGRMWSIEFDPRHAALARDNLAAAGLADRVEVCQGAGVDVLPQLEKHGPMDLMFVDADKISYHHYARWAVANLRPGGVIIGDNAYLFGELLDESDRGRAMREFHTLVAEHFDSVCVATPDGMVVGIKR